VPFDPKIGAIFHFQEVFGFQPMLRSSPTPIGPLRQEMPGRKSWICRRGLGGYKVPSGAHPEDFYRRSIERSLERVESLIDRHISTASPS